MPWHMHPFGAVLTALQQEAQHVWMQARRIAATLLADVQNAPAPDLQSLQAVASSTQQLLQLAGRLCLECSVGQQHSHTLLAR